MSAAPDKPNVVAFPGMLYALAFAAAVGLHLVWPLVILPAEIARWVGVGLCVIGGILIFWGVATMRAAKTNIYPELPATALVTTGPFRFTRNPLYVSLDFLFLGLTAEINTFWGLVVLLPLLAVMHYGVILREEKYLESKFGDSYRQYRSAVKRSLFF